MSSLTKKISLLNLSRFRISTIHSNAALVDNCSEVENKNPRNLELMRIAMKPQGFHLEKTTREFWHQLIITRRTKFVDVKVNHTENGSVITASTKEWSLKKRLYSCNDSAAYINLGRVLAQRCLESGIHAIHVDSDMERSGKTDLLLTQLEENGIALKEPSRYKKANPWDLHRVGKPWDIQEK